MRDLFVALIYAGPRMHPAELARHASTSKQGAEASKDIRRWTHKSVVRKKRENVPIWGRWCDDWLASDDEDADVGADNAAEDKAITWGKKRKRVPSSRMAEIPTHLPALPPRHTWSASPAFPAQAASSQEPLSFIDMKVSSTRLTEASLRSLIRATDSAAFDGHLRRVGRSNDAQIPAGAAARTGRDIAGGNVEMGAPTAPPSSRVRSPSVQEGDARRGSVQRKGKGLSLRLRTTSTTSLLGGNDASNAADEATPALSEAADKQKHARRQSQPFSGSEPASAFPSSGTPLALSHRRGSSFIGRGSPSGPYSAATNAAPGSLYPWSGSAAAQSGGGSGSGAMTPLTPGAGFVYPSTPADLYGGTFGAGSGLESGTQNGIAVQASGEDGLDEAANSINIPGVVNYKRTWYKKSSTSVGGGGGGGGGLSSNDVSPAHEPMTSVPQRVS